MANSRIDELRRRLERDPGSRLFAHLAEELRKAGEVDEAISVGRAGLEQHPNYPSARLTLGRALLDAGNPAEAKIEFERAVREAPDNILASRLLGEALETLGDLGGALVQYRATLEMAPDDQHVESRIRAIEERLGGGGAPATGAPEQPPQVTKPMAAVEPPEAEDRDDGKLAPTVRVQMPGNSALEPRAPLPPTTGGAPTDRQGATPPVRAEPGAATGEHVPGDPEVAPTLPPARHSALDTPLPPTLPMGVRVGPDGVIEGAGGGGDPVPGPARVPADARDLGTDTADVAETAQEVARPSGVAMEVVGDEPAEGEPPSPGEPDAATAGPDSGQPPLSSATLAELYFQQGLLERAVEVFRQVLEEEPGNDAVRGRLAEIETTLSEARPLPVAPSGEEDERALRRRALERTIARLEALLVVVRRGR